MKKEEKKQVYILCPKCELNYMTKKDKMCPVCKAESGLSDKSILLVDEEDAERICPVCKINPLSEDEEVCFMCLKEKPKEETEQEEWVEPAEEEKLIENDEIEISLDLAAEEEEAEEEEEFAEQYKEPDDFYYDVDPDDFEDEELDGEEEDDDL